MKIIIFILGIILAFEGAIYALFPLAFKNLLMQLKDIETEKLRYFGLGAMALGVVLVWLSGMR